tara:strand:- start:863 stop:1057 length:195 start_codon:yes stop_codon:yes gene_type:complete
MHQEKINAFHPGRVDGSARRVIDALLSRCRRTANISSKTARRTSRTNHGDKRLTVFAAFDAARI